jgi:CheY-like chemotaxis protein
MKPNVTSNAIFKNNATVVVADPKPLSLLATAGVLHHDGLRCVCARTIDAVLKACGVGAEGLVGHNDLVDNGDPSNADAQHLADELVEMVDDAAAAALRVDEGETGVPEKRDVHVKPTANVDLLIWDVGDQVIDVLGAIEQIRESLPELPVILLAESKWAGLEKKTEAMSAPTRCLYKPIDPSALLAVAEPLLWMPALQTAHRQRGSRPSRPGWLTL